MMAIRSWASTDDQLGAGGSIVANAGLIKEFGTGGEGVRALDPTWRKLFILDLFATADSQFRHGVLSLWVHHNCPLSIV